MSSLTGQKIKDTYQSLLKTSDNGLITTAFKQITDGSGSASGLYLRDDSVLISGSLDVTGTVSGSLYNEAFSKNRTTPESVNIVKQYQSIFNPTNLLIQLNDIFIVEDSAEYYVLGDLINSGSLIVSGTVLIDGALTSIGAITGPGIIL